MARVGKRSNMRKSKNGAQDEMEGNDEKKRQPMQNVEVKLVSGECSFSNHGNAEREMKADNNGTNCGKINEQPIQDEEKEENVQSSQNEGMIEIEPTDKQCIDNALNQNLRESEVISEHCRPKTIDVPGFAKNQYVVYDHVILQGNRIGTNLFYTTSEKKLYSKNSTNAKGLLLRCATDMSQRKCRANRILTKSGVIIGLISSQPHTCVSDGEQNYKNICAKTELKDRCRQIDTVAGNLKIAVIRKNIKLVNEK